MTNLNVYQSPATLKCDEGFNLKDNTTKTKCQANGTWTRPLPSAEGDSEKSQPTVTMLRNNAHS